MTVDISSFGCSQSAGVEATPCKAGVVAMENIKRGNPTRTLADAMVSVSQIRTQITDPVYAFNSEYIMEEANNPSADLSSYAAGSDMVMGFGDCGCDGMYANTGCGCDCNPRGYNWNKPTSGCMKKNMWMFILLLILAGVIIYCLMSKKQ